MRLALVTTRTLAGSADRHGIVPELARRVELEIFVESGTASTPLGDRRLRPVDELRPRDFDQVLFDVRDEAACSLMPPLVRAIGGAVLLDRWNLFDLALARRPELGRGGRAGFLAALVEGGLRQALVCREAWRSGGPAALAARRDELALNRSVVRFGDSFLVHSDHLRRRILEDRNAPTPIGTVRRGVEPERGVEDRRGERARLGLDPQVIDSFLVSSSVGEADGARLDVLLQALAVARRSRPRLGLILTGGEDGNASWIEGRSRVAGVADLVRCVRSPDRTEVGRWLAATDLGVELAESGAARAVRMLALGRGVVATAVGELRELPPDCVYKVLPGDGEAARLAQRIVELLDSPAVLRSMEREARAFVQRECTWDRVAEAWVERLEGFPRPRGSRRTLWTLRLRAATARERGFSS